MGVMEVMEVIKEANVMDMSYSLLMSSRVSLVVMLWVVWWGAMEDWKRPMKAPMAPPTTYDRVAFSGQLSPIWICLIVFVLLLISASRKSSWWC